MKINYIADNLRKLDNKRTKWIATQLTKMDRDVAVLQEKLLNLIFAEYLGKFKRDTNGNLLLNEFNVNLANELDGVFDKFNKAFHDNYLKEFGTDLLNMTSFTKDYYNTIGISSTTINSVIEKMTWLEPTIGIKVGKDIQSSTIIPGSYLDKLSQADSVRIDVKDFVLQNIAAKSDYKTYVEGLSNLILGTDEVDGRLASYYKQYAYDTYNQVEATADLYVADNLALEWFIYEGDVVDKSRPFCEERAGNVYNRNDIEQWRQMDWKGKNPDIPFEISRGGYNCRHRINWISEELAQYYGAEI